MIAFPNTPTVRSIISLALEEDMVRDDITANLTVPDDLSGTARIVAREPLVVCGLPLISLIFKTLNWDAKINYNAKDGDFVKDETVLAEIKGKVRHLVAAERSILNFLQRLSGVATLTKEFVDAALGLKILDTRKTIPGLRVLEKYAVAVGGGHNHRMNLGDMILVKNNHIDAHGGDVATTLKTINTNKPKGIKVEIEARTLGEIEKIIPFTPDFIMLDNMNDDTIRKAVKIIRDKAPNTIIEVSGGITKERLAILARLGVDCVSVGALTTKALNKDISMRIV